MLRLWLILGALAAFLAYWTIGALSPAARKRLWQVALVAAVVAALVVLIRIGQPWLAAAGAVVATVLRWVGPLVLRGLPFLIPWLRRRRTGEAAPPHVGARAHPETMTRAEALEVLGLREEATEEDVRDAYSALIKKVHPDRGGTTYLAARVNLARDLLLGKRQ